MPVSRCDGFRFNSHAPRSSDEQSIAFLTFPSSITALMFPISAAVVAVALSLTTTFLLLHCLRLFRRETTLVISLSPANHSPRVLAHATSISHHTNTILIALPPFPDTISFACHPLYTPSPPTSLLRKLFFQSVSLIRALLVTAPQNVTTIIVNTPPALPTLPILLFARPIFPRATLIIDWHNLAYTLMSPSSSLTPVAKFIERQCAPFASVHWTVSQAMAHFLHHQFSLNPTVVYDTPRKQFITAARSMTPASTRLVLTRLSQLATRIGPSHDPNNTTIIVTSTSWTPDEDFDILFDALLSIDQTFDPLIVVITGRGPLREAYEQRFRRANFKNVAVWTAWLPIDDYPRLLASATLGLSLHASSSGLDLPMKAVDMLACRLPVVALRYKCIHELVKNGINGFLFQDAKQLTTILRRLLDKHSDEIHQLLKGVEKAFDEGMEWEAYWRRTALPTIPSIS